jgi:hypothetical protein
MPTLEVIGVASEILTYGSFLMFKRDYRLEGGGCIFAVFASDEKDIALFRWGGGVNSFGFSYFQPSGSFDPLAILILENLGPVSYCV